MIKDIIAKLRRRRDTFKAMEDQDLMVNRIQNKKKSLNEIQLDKFQEREREEQIKMRLKQFQDRDRKIDQEANMLKAPNMFANAKNDILNEDGNILHQKNIFTNQKSMFMGKGGFM